MKKEIKIFIDNQEIEYYELDEYLKNVDMVYKDNGKWFIQYKKEDKKIEKLNFRHFHKRQRQLANKINEIIEVLNKCG